jgi:hypothetical protein
MPNDVYVKINPNRPINLGSALLRPHAIIAGGSGIKTDAGISITDDPQAFTTLDRRFDDEYIQNLAASGDVLAPAANTTAIITYPASGVGLRHVIGGVSWSYDATPTSGNIKIEDGAGTSFLNLDITASGPGQIEFDPPKKGSPNTDMIVTLYQGGPNVKGKLTINEHWVE